MVKGLAMSSLTKVIYIVPVLSNKSYTEVPFIVCVCVS